MNYMQLAQVANKLAEREQKNARAPLDFITSFIFNCISEVFEEAYKTEQRGEESKH
jgi:hypothetical protein